MTLTSDFTGLIIQAITVRLIIYLKIRDIRRSNREGEWDFGRERLRDTHYIGKRLYKSKVIVSKKGVVEWKNACSRECQMQKVRCY